MVSNAHGIRLARCEATLRSRAAIEAAVSVGDTDSLRVELYSMRGGLALAGD